MGKVIGLMTAWAAPEWIVPAIYNHLKICDKIVVCIVPFHKLFIQFDPAYRTLEIVKREFYTNSRVIFVNSFQKEPVKTLGNEQFKCNILNMMLKLGVTHYNDILMICDVDEFYDHNAIAELQEEFLKEDWDQLDVKSRFFCINMEWYVASDHPRFIRVNSRDFYFKPTQKPVPLRQAVKIVLQDHPMFHYSMLMGLDFKRVHWQTEKINYHADKLRWLDEVYALWNQNDPELCERLSTVNEKFFGVHGFWLKKTAKPFLARYRGHHPDEIENTAMRFYDDFRKPENKRCNVKHEFMSWEKDVGEIIWRNAIVVDNEILPFLNRDFLESLKKHDISKWSVFEWGAGFSTLWFGRRVAKLVSVENDETWFRKLQSQVGQKELSRVDLRLRPLEAGLPCKYTEAINEDNEKYDMIIVDGRNRSLCGMEALKHLKPGGWIVLDDAQREKYGILKFALGPECANMTTYHANKDVRGMANDTAVWGFK